ncbi:hypothetical protein NDU88_006530 [Pleurodeles waltl]|uniref:Uncharacterized protein n=1 Tax=Pleurodeles waltl TaxID=8319 RepID=A0AAV7VQY9_PLEWA|nr:hypothetical protein NDU88_006530 [Pleurodeles waltl]
MATRTDCDLATIEEGAATRDRRRPNFLGTAAQLHQTPVCRRETRPLGGAIEPPGPRGDPTHSESHTVSSQLGGLNTLEWLIGRVTLLRHSNILLKVADRVWWRYVNRGPGKPPYSPKTPLLAIPGIHKLHGRVCLTAWATKGLRLVGELFAEGQFISYEVLATTYNLGQGGFIMYDALQSLIRNAWGHGRREPQSSPILHELLSDTGKPARISWIHNTLRANPEEVQSQAKI